jgi:predicted transglutaminase-like cysteine proteinase
VLVSQLIEARLSASDEATPYGVSQEIWRPPDWTEGGCSEFFIHKEYTVKSKLFKISAAVGLLSASVVAIAANACCGNLAACCLEMLACCF